MKVRKNNARIGFMLFVNSYFVAHNWTQCCNEQIGLCDYNKLMWGGKTHTEHPVKVGKVLYCIKEQIKIST